MYQFLNIHQDSQDSSIKVVELNRPQVKNAFNPEMITELTNEFRKISLDRTTKVVVLKGAGNVFCAGADLNWMKEMVQYSFEQNLEDSGKLWDMFQAIADCEVPIVGYVHGAVYGGALGLVACCDHVIAHTSAQFCFSEVRLGLSPAVISAFILRKCADALVRPFMLSAEVFNSEVATRLGLVHKVVESEDIAWTEIRKYSSLGTEAIRETKKLLNQIEFSKNASSWQQQKKMTTQVISERRMSTEGQERLIAFLKK